MAKNSGAGTPERLEIDYPFKEVSKTDVFVESAGRSLESLGEGVVNVAKDPEGTAMGLGAGVKRFGINLGRKSKRLADDVMEGDDGEEEKSAGENAEGVANTALRRGPRF